MAAPAIQRQTAQSVHLFDFRNEAVGDHRSVDARNARLVGEGHDGPNAFGQVRGLEDGRLRELGLTAKKRGHHCGREKGEFGELKVPSHSGDIGRKCHAS